MDFLRNRFILVAVDARHARRRKDWAGDFVRKTRCVTFTAAGRKAAVSANGKVLGNIGSFKSLKKAWDVWKALPESERLPNRVKVGDHRPVDRAHEPPKGALIVRTYTRQLTRKKDGSFRYTEAQDYPQPQPRRKHSGAHQRLVDRLREAGHDFMWIPEAEWRALIPKSPKPGLRGAVPLTFKLRVLRYHLDPERGLGEAQWFTRAQPKDGALEWIVERASSQEIRLRLEGRARLERKGGKQGLTTYAPSLLAYMTYDVREKKITDFKMIALGDVLNTPRGVRPGLHPLGIAFEIVHNPTPAERVVPRGARDNVDRYLQIKLR